MRLEIVWNKERRAAYRVGVLSAGGASNRKNVRRAEVLVKSGGLTCVYDEEDFVVSFFLPHLLEGIGQVSIRGVSEDQKSFTVLILAPAADLFKVLELEELITSMTSHVDEDIAVVIRQHTLGTWDVIMMPT